jgi:membrane-bound serine protease (ClpP class)
VSYVNKRLTKARLLLAVITTTLEEIAIYAIWCWVLPGFDIILPVGALIGMMVSWGIFSVSLFVLTSNILKKQIPAGLPSMVGTRGRVTSPLSPEGMVRIKGELWAAKSKTGSINAGEDVEVVGEDGLKLVVLRSGRTGVKR